MISWLNRKLALLNARLEARNRLKAIDIAERDRQLQDLYREARRRLSERDEGPQP